MSEANASKPRTPGPFKGWDLARRLEGTDALRKGSRSIDELIGGPSMRQLLDIAAATRLEVPGSRPMSQMDEFFEVKLQLEGSSVSKMMKKLSLPDPNLFQKHLDASPVSKMRLDLEKLMGSPAHKADLWSAAALKGLPDWTQSRAAAKLVSADRDLARYASFLGEASTFKDTWKAIGLGEASATPKAMAGFLPPGNSTFALLTSRLARTVDPFGGALKAAGQWEASLATRMASINAAWTCPDDLGLSMLGFARIARLSDAVHAARPFGGEVAELVTEELGTGADYNEEETPAERDSAAVRAGLKSDLITFPELAYDEVIFAAGFQFRLAPTPVPMSLEGADTGALFDTDHSALLTAVEQRLRQCIEEKLSAVEGPAWVKRRVAEQVRKRWSERQQEDRDLGRPVYALIQYADFMDLADVILQSNNWKQSFAAVFGNKDDFQVALRRLHPVRKAIAHGRPLCRADVLTLANEATRILRALGINLLQ